MKNLYFLAFLLLIIFQSCDNFNEEIYLNKDGSGEYLIYTDAVAGMRTMLTQMNEMFEDSTQRLNVEEQIWRDFPENIDSIMPITERVPDSVANNPELMRMINKTLGFTRGGREAGYVYMGLQYKFDDLSDLINFIEFIEKTQKEQISAGTELTFLKDFESNIQFEFTGNTFNRKVEIIRKPEVSEEELNMFTMFVRNGKYKTIIHLPKNIKTVDNDYVVQSENNTVVLEYNLTDYLLGNIDSSFEIIMEDKK